MLATRIAPGGGGRLTLEAEGFLPGIYANGPYGPLGTDRVYVLLAAASLRVHVRDAEGRPIPNAHVTVTSTAPKGEARERRWPWLEWEAVTDAEGAIVGSFAANRELEAVIGAPGYCTQRVTASTESEAEVILQPSARVRLSVVDDATGRALTATAELYREEPAPGMWCGSSEDAQGGLLFDRDVGEGTYSATIRKYGWETTSVKVRVPKELGMVEDTVRLQQRGGFRCISIALTTEEGRASPVDGRTVHVFRRPEALGADVKAVAEAWSTGHSFEDVVQGRVTLGVRTVDRCDLYIVDGARNLVGLLEDSTSPAPDRVVRLQPGVAFFATPSRWGVRAQMRELRVVSREFGPLPSWSLDEKNASVGGIGAPKSGQRFGPYPMDAVVVVLCEDGSSVSIPVAEAAK